jgi:hypothetical protein
MFHKKKSSNEVYKKMFANIIQKSKQLLNSNNNMGVPKHATVANKDGTKPI